MIWGWTFCFAPFKHPLLGTSKKQNFLSLLLSLFKSIDKNASKEKQNAINNNKGVEKACWKHQWHHIRICFLRAIGGTTMLGVENVGYNVKRHQKIHRGHCKSQKILFLKH
jgi:hypothetical protein